ncbi:MAG: cytochrome P450 [Halieaceae bacterium]|jgi:cholest-4-en-3-one 26-monooxygenase|nr:cytochrome P450 [Halieaceae bacterium]
MTDKCPFQADLMNPMTHNRGLPFDAFARLRSEQPVSYQNGAPGTGGDYWAITRREELDFVSKNPALFSSSINLAHPQPGGSDPESLEIMRQLIINMDPPDHIKYRRVVSNAFTSKAVDALEPLMRDFARKIVDKVMPRGECEFVSEVAAEMPLFVICSLMEMPVEKRQTFSSLVDVMIGMDDPEMDVSADDGQLAAAQIFEIAMELAASHKAAPKGGTVIDALLNGVVEGESLNEFEFCSFFLILIAGAVETTRTATSQGMRLLIENPDQHQLLIDSPGLIPDAVEEILRFYPPFIQMQRTATTDVTLGEKQIRKGDLVRLFYPSVNHDPEQFGDDADVFDITRGQRMKDLKNQHRTFGVGQHFCIGSHLARKELSVMFEEIVPRMRNPRLKSAPHNLVSNFIPGIKEMYISFDTGAG